MLLRRGWLVAASCFLVPAAAQAQPARGRGELRGTVVAAATGQPVASASVAVRAAGDTALAGGATAHADGTFRVEGVRPGRYTVRIRALGYAPLVRANVVVAAGGTVELGRIALANVAAQLGGVQVKAERDAATLSAEGNTYTTKDLAAASGGTAIDVLRNVPQVEVDGDNNVSVRGNQNVVVQINGRPTPLKGQQLGNYLAQLPANLVAKVDVITNPSAKNDPDGAAGIINITLTQRTDLGTSGGFNAATATSGLANLSGNVGRQQGPWTGFASYGFYHDVRRQSGTSDRFDASGAVPTTLSSTVAGRMQPAFQNATLRGEYKLAPHDALAADAVFNTGVFTRTNDAYYTASTAAAAGAATSRFAQLTDARQTSTTGDYALAWRHIVDPATNALSVELRLNDAQNGFRNVLRSQPFLLDGTPDPAAVVRPSRDLSSGRTPTWRLQSDWTRALAAGTKLEAGVLGIRRRTASAFETAIDSGTGFARDDARSNAFTYHENVESVYGVLTRKTGPFELQGGLRLEQATTHFDLATPNAIADAASGAAATTGQHFDNGYKSVFPSALVAYNFDAQRQVKASYSRRISRPDPGQLNPFEQREDALNIFQGNPALRPEYTDAYELGYQHGFSKGSVQLSPFFRRTPNAVRFIRTVDTAGVTRSTFANVARSEQYGTDLNVSLRLGRFTGFGGASASRNTTDAHNVTPDVSFRTFSWSARGNGTYKLTPALDLQAFAFYRAPMAVEGGRLNRFAMSSFALKRRLRGDAASVTLRAQDPFNTMAWGMRTVDGALVQITDRRFGARALSLNFNYTFGKPPNFRPRTDDTPQQAPGGGGGPPG